MIDSAASENLPWWQVVPAPAPIRSESHEWIFQLAQQGLAIKALKENAPAPLRVGAAGPTSNERVYLEFREMMTKLGARVIEEAVYAWDDDFEEVYVWDSGAAFVTTADENTAIGVNLVTTNSDVLEEVREFLSKNILRQTVTNEGKVHILVSSPEGVTPQPLGFAAVPLVLDHYSPEIHDNINRLLTEIRNPFPDGRLTILEGPPGCGKTFLIRSLVHELPETNFVFIPPSLVPSLGDPSLVHALIKMHRDNGSRVQTTVLICEDADTILTRRGSDNMSAISSVLNLSSGILGDVVDVRILATTNAQRADIDSAILRPGRLSQYIKVGPITKDRADLVLSRLTKTPNEKHEWPAARIPSFGRGGGVGFASNDEIEVPSAVLLADVFKEAKKRGWVPDRVQAKVAATKILPRRTRSWIK